MLTTHYQDISPVNDENDVDEVHAT